MTSCHVLRLFDAKPAREFPGTLMFDDSGKPLAEFPVGEM